MRTPEDIDTDPDGIVRLGRVMSVDLAAARCTVSFDDDAESPPLRWMEARMGATRTWSPPSVGEQVILLCPAGEIAAAVVLRGLVSEARPAPGASTRELIQFEDGAVLAYDPASHELEAVLPAGGTVSIIADGGVTIDGNVTILGDLGVIGQVTSTVDVVAAGKSLKSHKHGNVQAGAAQTGEPV